MIANVVDVLDGIPWAVPGAVAAILLAAAIARPLARRRTGDPWATWVVLASAGVIAAVTLTPSVDPFGGGGCDWSIEPLALATLLTVSDRTLNVALFVPIGLAIGGLRTRHRLAWLLVALAAAPAIELTQRVLSPLGRTCQATDVIDNWLGLVLGFAVARVAVWAWRAVRDRSGQGRS